MSESKEKILQMLQDGTISPEEADRLLLAVGNTEWEEPDGGGENEERSVPEISADDVQPDASPAELPPDFEGLRDSWRTPFNIVLALMGAFFVLSMALMRSTKGVLSFGGKLLLSLALFAALVAAYIWSSRDGLWLHVRVNSSDGTRIRISMPLSTRLMRWGMQTGREYADEQALEYIDMVDGLLTAWEEDPNQDPMIIDVNDEGDHVQVFIG